MLLMVPMQRLQLRQTVCSDITGITTSNFNRLFRRVALSKVYPVFNFDGSAIAGIQGTCDASVAYKGREGRIRIHVFPDAYGNVLGRDAMRALDLVLDGMDGSVKVITAKAQDISKVEASSSFDAP